MGKKKAAEKEATPTMAGLPIQEVKPSSADRKPGLRVLALRSENIKRIKVVTIRPKGNMVHITGENESGKSSLLDSIEWGLCGTSTLPSQPIRRGEPTGKIEIDLGDYRITRHFSKAGTKLVVEGRHREQFKSPQQLLDDLMGKISFDPLAFIRMESPKQLQVLRKLVKLDIDIDALDAANKEDYNLRREEGRKADALKARLAAMPEYPNAPADPVDVNALTSKLQSASDHNSNIAKQKQQVASDLEKASNADRKATEHRETIAKLQEEIRQLEGAILVEESYARNLRIVSDELTATIPAPIDTAEVAAQISTANTTNAQIEKQRQRETVEGELVKANTAWDDYTATMDERTKQKMDAIAAAKFPVEKLGFGDDEVLYDGLPFTQASNAVQIRVSVALAMASNPTIRVLRIKDGSLLDSKSMKLIEQMADENDYQVWIETVEGKGAAAIVMVDGEASGEGAE